MSQELPVAVLCVRTGSPRIQKILELDFRSLVTANVSTEVTLTGYSADGESLVLGTDYDVYCFAQDDLCVGCSVASGIDMSVVLQSLTPVRTADTTPPQLRIISWESTAFHQILITSTG